MPTDGHIDYVEMPARDLAATRAFFERAFGWTFEAYGADYVAFADAGVAGGFFVSEQTATTAQGSALVVLYGADLEGTREAVRTAGGVLARDIFSFPGGRRFHFLDPSGNEWAVWSEASGTASGDAP